MNIIITTAIILSTCGSMTFATFQFTEISNDTPMIISKLTPALVAYDTFKSVFYIDLKPYYELTETITQCIQVADDLCVKSENVLCQIIKRHHLHAIEMLENDSETLTSYREKRFTLCEFCGGLMHHVYGVMDKQTAEEYAKFINENKNTTI